MDSGQLQEAVWGFIQVMGSVLQGKAVGTPAEKYGRHSGLTSSSSIPAQDSEPRRGGLMGWGEGLLPVSSWEGRGHHSDTVTTHSWERCLLWKSWYVGKGQRGTVQPEPHRGLLQPTSLKDEYVS